jgi:pyridoxine 5-phosphate synthase
MLKLGVNIDHVATLRQARGVDYPSPLEAAQRCVAAGAHGITAHLREDRRHIQDDDIRRLKDEVAAPLNLEMACAAEIVRFACELRPAEVCLVPEKRAELTTEGGLDVVAGEAMLRDVTSALQARNIVVSLFIDPEPQQLDAAQRIGAEYVELHTGAFCNAHGTAAAAELERLRQGARHGHELGLKINAGHGITMETIDAILGIPHLDTLNIGHSIIARAVMIGIDAAVREMLDAMAAYRGA